jgi:hypothetical protein
MTRKTKPKIRKPTERGTKTLSNKIDKLERILETMQAENDLEGSIGDNDTEKNIMYTVNRQNINITGDPTDILTKTRFDDNVDVELTLEPFTQRVYQQLQNTRYGGDSILLDIDLIETGQIDLKRYSQYQIWPKLELIDGKKYLRCFIDMNSIRTDLILHGRFASMKGKARIEDIHKAGARREGQGYIDAHTPAPPIYASEGYNDKPKRKSEALESAILDPVDEK